MPRLTDLHALYHIAFGDEKRTPFPYQLALAEHAWPELLVVPTGLGKTAAVVLGWLWRRQWHPDPGVRRTTPRRLIYCLPTRTLVDQVYCDVKGWVHRLRRAIPDLGPPVHLHMLRGGYVPSNGAEQALHPKVGREAQAQASGGSPAGREEDDLWLHPEEDAILIGTQDMLLSRALMRGYASSRYRWPVEFALVHNDVQWVIDEVQLMGSGLQTTAQLAAFRKAFGTFGPAHTLWMSATCEPEWLKTIDYPAPDSVLRLSDADHREELVQKRLAAKKRLGKAKAIGCDQSDYAARLAQEVLEQYAGGVALVICNTVRRAQEVYQKLEQPATEAGVELLLLHSRFRPVERQEITQHLVAFMEQTRKAEGNLNQEPRRIIVSTQAVEAGVDLSARLLVTELAPWASLVQRFGRCNRFGDLPEGGGILWVDIKPPEREPEKGTAPYTPDELKQARQALGDLGDDASLTALEAVARDKPFVATTPRQVLRRPDLLDLYDTTPDLTGSDLDVSGLIREADDHELYVYWREKPVLRGDNATSLPLPGELCPAPISDLREWIKKGRPAWHWDHLAGSRNRGAWRQLRQQDLRPGLIVLLDSGTGGYAPHLGWSHELDEPVMPLVRVESAEAAVEAEAETPGSDPESDVGHWVSLTEHTEDVQRETKLLLDALGDRPIEPLVREAVLTAALWHDVGKVHPTFVETIQRAAQEDPPPDGAQGPWAKSSKQMVRHAQPGFRHELASALAVRGARSLPDELRMLAAYVVAAHHGKVRMTIRSYPYERPKVQGGRRANGIEDGDELPEVVLPGGQTVTPIRLSLDPMELGGGTAGFSWVEDAQRLLARWGPFRLAAWEWLLRAADSRASARERESGTRRDAEQASEQASEGAPARKEGA